VLQAKQMSQNAVTQRTVEFEQQLRRLHKLKAASAEESAGPVDTPAPTWR
jgi:hypothetical protein